jgi:ribonucleotide monophosphatase NagD (HAD superfamily)
VGDVKGALESGLGAAILVKTGKYRNGDELVHTTEGVTPTLTLPSITEAVESIIESIKDEHS